MPRQKRICLTQLLSAVSVVLFAWGCFFQPVNCHAQQAGEVEVIKTLLIEGQNNHKNWRQTSLMMKAYLEQTDLFSVDVVRTRPKGTDAKFKPDFSQYDLVLSNYNGAEWPEETKTAFIEYMRGGGGLVVVHAADNAFGNWREFNEMIGLGGWGGRNEKSGPYIYLNEEGEVVRDESRGKGGHHGKQHEFSLVTRDEDHPIMQGLPMEWLHVQDELYDKLRGPAANMEILATSFASKKFGGTGRHEPMVMTIGFGEGRVFHTPMGHGNNSQECVGFITLLQRGAEWAATGNVTQAIPDEFPGPDEVLQRTFAAPVVASELGSTKNVFQIGNLFLSGQPSQADVQVIKEAGITRVISVRKPTELNWDEQAAIEAAGLSFHSISFNSPEGMTPELLDELRELLQKTSDEKVLLHCGSATRASMVWSAYRTLDQGKSVEDVDGEIETMGLGSKSMRAKAKAYIEENKR